MKRDTLLQAACVCLIAASSVLGDVDSGPAVGNPVPELKVYAITGEKADQEITVSSERADKPTIWMFVPKEMWSRPMARLMKDLDGRLNEIEGAQLVAVWLTDDQFATKDYLPKAQQSIKLERSVLSYYQGDPAGPADWGINPDAEVTVVVTGGGTISAAWGFVSVNETVADQILEALQQAGSGT